MCMFRNNRILKKILGKKQYKELTNYTKKKVIDVFGKQPLLVTRKLIYANNAAVLIIAVLKTKKRYEKGVYISGNLNNQYLIENNIEDFTKEYVKYIDLIEKKLIRYKLK